MTYNLEEFRAYLNEDWRRKKDLQQWNLYLTWLAHPEQEPWHENYNITDSSLAIPTKEQKVYQYVVAGWMWDKEQTRLIKEINSYQEKLLELQEELSIQQRDNQQNISLYTTSTASLRAEINELKAQLETAEEEKKQLQEVTNLLTDTQEKLSTNQHDLSQIQQVNNELLAKITTLESELTSQEELITNLEKTKQEITNHLTELQTNLSDKNISLEEAQTEIAQLQLNLLYQQQLASKIAKEKVELTNSYAYLESQLEQLKKSTAEQLTTWENEKKLSEESRNNLLQQNKDLLQQKSPLKD